MGSCYSGDHIAGDHIRSNKTVCNIVEVQQKYRLGMVRNKLLRDLIEFYWLQTLVLCFCNISKHLVHMKVSQPINEST